jgi:hypothetical protein
MPAPQIGAIGEAKGLKAGQNTRRDADIHLLHLPAERSSRKKQMAGLAPEESDRHLGGGGSTHHLAIISVDPAWNIHGNNRQPAVRQSLYKGQCSPFQGPGQAGAKQGIDHNGPVLQQGRCRRQHYTAPLRRRPGGVPPQGGAFAQQGNAHGPPVSRQQGGRNESITAIIAGTTEHKHRRWTGGRELAHGIRHRSARGGHQLPATDTRSHGGLIGGIHLACGQ